MLASHQHELQLEHSPSYWILNKVYYRTPPKCDSSCWMAAIGAQPPKIHSSASLATPSSTVRTSTGALRNTRAFRAFHNLQETSSTSASKTFLPAASRRCLSLSHHSTMSSSWHGTRLVSWRRESTVCQTCRATTQPANKCAQVSDAWSHKEQVSLCCRPCRARRSDIHRRRCSTYQKKILTRGGALTFHNCRAPRSSDVPLKKAR